MRFINLQLSPRWKFLVSLLLLTMIATYAFIRSEQIRNHLEDVWEVNNAKSTILLDMRILLKTTNKVLDGAINKPDHEQATLKENMSRYHWLESSLSKNLEKSRLTTQNEKALIHKLTVDRTAAQQLLKRFEELLANNQTAAASELLTKELRTGPWNRWIADVDELIATVNESNAQAGVEAGIAYERLRTSVLLMCAAVIILGLFGMWLTIKRNADDASPVQS